MPSLDVLALSRQARIPVIGPLVVLPLVDEPVVIVVPAEDELHRVGVVEQEGVFPVGAAVLIPVAVEDPVPIFVLAREVTPRPG